MALSNVITGAAMAPPRLLIYGPPGVGKTTLAAGAGKGCIFVPTEGADLATGVRRPQNPKRGSTRLRQRICRKSDPPPRDAW